MALRRFTIVVGRLVLPSSIVAIALVAPLVAELPEAISVTVFVFNCRLVCACVPLDCMSMSTLNIRRAASL